jgi:hypothetical protein
MNRYLRGLALTLAAVGLLVIHQPVWSLLPAVAGVYILGSTLRDTMQK